MKRKNKRDLNKSQGPRNKMEDLHLQICGIMGKIKLSHDWNEGKQAQRGKKKFLSKTIYLHEIKKSKKIMRIKQIIFFFFIYISEYTYSHTLRYIHKHA